MAKKLVEFPQGPGIDLIDVKNTAGRSPLGEAENVGWDEGATWFVQVMKLDDQGDDALATMDPGQDIEVEIEDAEGKIAKMTVSGSNPASTAAPTGT